MKFPAKQFQNTMYPCWRTLSSAALSLLTVTALITHMYAESISSLKALEILFFYQYSIYIKKKDLSLMLSFCLKPWGKAGTSSLLLQIYL